MGVCSHGRLELSGAVIARKDGRRRWLSSHIGVHHHGDGARRWRRSRHDSLKRHRVSRRFHSRDRSSRGHHDAAAELLRGHSKSPVSSTQNGEEALASKKINQRRSVRYGVKPLSAPVEKKIEQHPLMGSRGRQCGQPTFDDSRSSSNLLFGSPRSLLQGGQFRIVVRPKGQNLPRKW